jgi:hypothetical protein
MHRHFCTIIFSLSFSITYAQNNGLVFSGFYSQGYTKDKIFKKTIDIKPIGNDLSFETKYLFSGNLSYFSDLKKNMFYKLGVELSYDYISRKALNLDASAPFSIFSINASIGKKIWQQTKQHFFIQQGMRLGFVVTKNYLFSHADLRVTATDTTGYIYTVSIYPSNKKPRLSGTTSFGYQNHYNTKWGFNAALEFAHDLNKPNENSITMEEFQPGFKPTLLKRNSNSYNQVTLGLRIGLIRFIND